MIKRMGVIGDIHGESEALKAALAYLKMENLDVIVCSGDVLGEEGDMDECCHLLKHHQVHTVSGNHDRWFDNNRYSSATGAQEVEINLKSIEFISGLPKTIVFNTIVGKLLLCHGFGENDMAGLTPNSQGLGIISNKKLRKLIYSKRYQFMVNGHTHLRMVRPFGGMVIINGGTLKKKYQPGFAVIDFVNKCVNLYDIEPDLRIGKAETLYLFNKGITFEN